MEVIMKGLLKKLIFTALMISLLLSLLSCQIPTFENLMGKDENTENEEDSKANEATDSDLPTPELDYEKAAANLEAAGYDLFYFPVSGLVLGAEKGFDASLIDPDGCEAEVLLRYTVFIDEELAELYYESERLENAKYWHDLENQIKIFEYQRDNYKSDFTDSEYKSLISKIESNKKVLEEGNGDYVLGINGKIVFSGLREVIEATKN